MTVNVSGRTITELIVALLLVCLMCVLVTNPLTTAYTHYPHMSDEDYEEIRLLEAYLIGQSSLRDIMRYEKLIIKQYMYEKIK